MEFLYAEYKHHNVTVTTKYSHVPPIEGELWDVCIQDGEYFLQLAHDSVNIFVRCSDVVCVTVD